MLNKDYYILLSMIETIDKIIDYCSAYSSAEELYQNQRDFDATMMNFIVIGQEVGKLSDELRAQNNQIDWGKLYGLRNILAHHYFGINVDTIWQIIINDIPKLKENIQLIIES